MPRTKYFVAHLLSGEAARYHKTLSRELSERFRTSPLHLKVEPHFTVKIPFEANDFEADEAVQTLADFAASHTPERYTISGFGRFGFRTVYLDVEKAHRATALVRECVSALNELPWMQRVPLEGNKLHASVARFMEYRQFRRVWRVVQSERPHFETILDSIAILKKSSGEPWQVHRTFAFTQPSLYAPMHLV